MKTCKRVHVKDANDDPKLIEKSIVTGEEPQWWKTVPDWGSSKDNEDNCTT